MENPRPNPCSPAQTVFVQKKKKKKKKKKRSWVWIEVSHVAILRADSVTGPSMLPGAGWSRTVLQLTLTLISSRLVTVGEMSSRWTWTFCILPVNRTDPPGKRWGWADILSQQRLVFHCSEMCCAWREMGQEGEWEVGGGGGGAYPKRSFTLGVEADQLTLIDMRDFW